MPNAQSLPGTGTRYSQRDFSVLYVQYVFFLVLKSKNLANAQLFYLVYPVPLARSS